MKSTCGVKDRSYLLQLSLGRGVSYLVRKEPVDEFPSPLKLSPFLLRHNSHAIYSNIGIDGLSLTPVPLTAVQK